VTETTRRERPTGRRAGDSGTRDAILDAALRLFAQHGFDKASLRAIAGEAGVDPALVRHFYGDKEALFATAVASRTTIVERVAAAVPGDRATAGVRVTTAYLGLWEDPATRAVLLALVRSATTSEHAADMLRDVLLGRIPSALGDLENPAVSRRLALAASHLMGLALARYVVRLPPLATLTTEELVAQVAPTIQRYLDGGYA
jgi:AcrR family transcriptional regulator